jgi:serine/threonine-protein kinase RsbW
MAEQPVAVRAGVVPHQGHARPVLWWARDFPGGTGQASQAWHWIADLLPECDPLDDLLLLAGELSANAVVHTRSGEPGGRFSVAVEWTPEAARVVIGDQGSPESAATRAKAGGTAWALESGRGLWLVDELADDWGTASHCAGQRGTNTDGPARTDTARRVPRLAAVDRREPPKAAVFAFAFYPEFLPRHGSVLAAALALATV